MALDIPVLAEEMFEHTETWRDAVDRPTQDDDDADTRFEVATSCYIVLSRLADLSVRIHIALF
jgi:hypothetical protein